MARVSATYRPGWGRGRVQAGLEAVLRATTRPSTAGPRLHARAGGAGSLDVQALIYTKWWWLRERLRERTAGGGGCGGAPMHHVRQMRCPGGAYFMPLRSTWLAAMSMTLMMKAMAKAQIRLLRTHVWRIC